MRPPPRPAPAGGPGQPWEATVLASGWDGVTVDLRTPGGTVRDLRVGLLGSHQAANAAVAVALLDALREDGERRGRPLPVDEAALRAGMAAARWPGRLELFPAGPRGRDVLLDGAHNPAGARALARALDELGVRAFPAGVRGHAREAGDRRPARPAPRSAAPRVHRGGRSARPPAGGAAADLAPGRSRRRGARRPGRSPRRPRTPWTAPPRWAADGPVVVAGSLYLVGAVRAALTGEATGRLMRTPDAGASGPT